MVAVVLASVGGQAQDEPPPNRYGLRAGFGLDPDQFVFGVQAELSRVLGILRFAPSLDFGFGDDIGTYLLNADLRLDLLPLPRSGSVFYVDGAPTLAILDPENVDSDLEIGFTVAAGLELPMGRTGTYNIEGRYGFGDIPEFRLLLGVYFGGGRGPEPPEPVEPGE